MTSLIQQIQKVAVSTVAIGSIYLISVVGAEIVVSDAEIPAAGSKAQTFLGFASNMGRRLDSPTYKCTGAWTYFVGVDTCEGEPAAEVPELVMTPAKYTADVDCKHGDDLLLRESWCCLANFRDADGVDKTIKRTEYYSVDADCKVLTSADDDPGCFIGGIPEGRVDHQLDTCQTRNAMNDSALVTMTKVADDQSGARGISVAVGSLVSVFFVAFV